MATCGTPSLNLTRNHLWKQLVPHKTRVILGLKVGDENMTSQDVCGGST